jgi:hypothetical protein
MTGPTHAKPAGVDPRTASPATAWGGAGRPPRRRARSVAGGDRVALGIGVAAALLILAWFAWRLAQTVARDRAVGPGVAPPAAAHGH